MEEKKSMQKRKKLRDEVDFVMESFVILFYLHVVIF